MKSLFLLLFLASSVFCQEKARVYVYSYAAATTFGTVKKPVFLNGKEIADIRPERYFIVLLEPGRHAFHLKNKKLGGIEKEFESGKIYYLRVDWRSGAVVSPQGFVSVSDDNGAFDIKQLKPVDKKNIKDGSLVVLN
jgi:hypothetical protein